MFEKIKKIIKKPFIQNVTKVLTGTAAAQFIALLLSPIITRVYGPEAFGLMGSFVAITSIIGPISALTYPIAIVLPKNESDAIDLVRLSMRISVLISTVILITNMLFNKQIATLFGLENISLYLYFLPLVTILAAYMQVREQWIIRNKQFGVSAKVTIIHSLIINFGKVGVGFLYPTATVLILFSTINQGLKAILFKFFSPKNNYFKSNPDKNSIKLVAKRYKDFAYFRAPEVLLNNFSQNIPILMLSAFFSPSVAGYYTLVKNVLGIPSKLLGKSVGDVFYSKISEAANARKALTGLVVKTTLGLGIIGIIPYGIVMVLGPWLFTIVFGESWNTAGEYARWIALWSFFGFMNRASIMALPVISAQALQLLFSIIMLIVRTGMLSIGFFWFTSDLLAIKLFGISGAILNIALIIVSIYLTNKYDKSRKNYVL